MSTEITLYIDADACPVKDEVLKVSYRHNLPVYMVSNQWMRMEVGDLVHKIVVSQGADAADDWIVEHIKDRNIVITADILLAKRCLEKGSKALGPTGKIFSENNIGIAVAMRDLNSHLRETGESKGYNAIFTQKDRSTFLQELERMIVKLSG